MNKIFEYVKNFDWILLSSVILLACFGLIEIYSIGLGRGANDLINFNKQILFLSIGISMLFIFSFINFHTLKNFSAYLYVGAIVALITVLIFGVSIRGTRGWFSVLGFNIQPVEFVKVALIIFLARFFSNKATKNRSSKQFLISGIGSLFLVGLVFLQPDFGSALILFSVWLFMLVITGFRRKYFVILGTILIMTGIVLWNFSFEDYQKNRILTFLNPTANSLAEGYNVAQAIIAVGAGNITGRGFGAGSQSQLKFLPEAQNDFIFAVIGEELGFLGVSLVLFLYGVFFFRCLANIRKINDDFAIFFILGAVGLIFIEMFTNISMNIGILPVVGISLPFISYGGSSIISTFMIVGIIENIAIHQKKNY